jgi:hypothetical protein
MNELSNELRMFMMQIADRKITCYIMNIHRKLTSPLHEVDSRQEIHLPPSQMRIGSWLATFVMCISNIH